MASTDKKSSVNEAKVALLEHAVKNVSKTDELILELQQQLANVNFYIAKTIFRREIGLPSEPLTDEELRGKGRNL